MIGVNGAAARLTQTGQRVIILAFVYLQPPEIPAHQARVVIVNDRNRVAETVEHAAAD